MPLVELSELNETPQVKKFNDILITQKLQTSISIKLLVLNKTPGNEKLLKFLQVQEVIRGFEFNSSEHCYKLKDNLCDLDALDGTIELFKFLLKESPLEIENAIKDIKSPESKLVRNNVATATTKKEIYGYGNPSLSSKSSELIKFQNITRHSMVAQAVFILEMPRLENFSPILNGSKISQEFASYMKEKHQVTFKATFNGKDQEEPWLLENASKLDDIFGKFKQTNAWTEYGKTLSWDQRNH